MKRLVLALAVLGALVVWSAALAARRPAARPDFNGRWTLLTRRSIFGDLPQPLARTDVIEHAEPRIRQVLHLTNVASLDTAIYLYVTDSTETRNKVGGQTIRSVVSWEGPVLHLFSKTRMAMVLEMSLDERWRLSPRGDSLVMTRRVESPVLKGAQRLVFVRDSVSAQRGAGAP